MKNKIVQIFGKIIVAIAGFSLLATSIYLLASNRANSAPWPAIAAGLLGWILLKPGKRSARITMGGVVLDIISDDTGAIRRTIDSQVTHISQEISERTRLEVLKTPPPIPEK